jgi:hypothetical protein
MTHRSAAPEVPPSSASDRSASQPRAGKAVIHMNIGDVGQLARIGQLQPCYAFNLDVATRRSAREIASARLYETGFPRVVRCAPPDEEMLESARRAVSPRARALVSGPAAVAARSLAAAGQRDTKLPAVATSSAPAAAAAAASPTTTTFPMEASSTVLARQERDRQQLARELDAIGGGGGFNLSLLSTSRYYHGAQSTVSGLSEASKRSPRNAARAKIRELSELPYGREAFPGISDTRDSLYGADYCRRYCTMAPERYTPSIEVLKDGNRTPRATEAPKYLTQTPRGREHMSEMMSHRPKREPPAVAGGYF